MDSLNLPKKGCCKYPLGDPQEKSFRYCDAPKAVTDSYCEEHKAICYVKNTRKETAMARVELNAARKLLNKTPISF